MAQKRSMNILFTVRFVRRDKQKNSQHGRDFFFCVVKLRKEKKSKTTLQLIFPNIPGGELWCESHCTNGSQQNISESSKCLNDRLLVVCQHFFFPALRGKLYFRPATVQLEKVLIFRRTHIQKPVSLQSH